VAVIIVSLAVGAFSDDFGDSVAEAGGVALVVDGATLVVGWGVEATANPPDGMMLCSGTNPKESEMLKPLNTSPPASPSSVPIGNSIPDEGDPSAEEEPEIVLNWGELDVEEEAA